MRLKCIKLAGFKSFVDPTTVDFPSNLCAVVGPNGCGKSNIIDAVRWVMGESSAKNLRGESMTDVIFNGSSGRKPVGQASIELVFDNSDYTLVGEYAAYTEISIKRRVGRDGENQYFLNGQKCRRKDITDLFLGTGLGPRSYAIIEQGMISKLIEAKPEELRVYIEEAAGISKYKERRRETENRIRRTLENLERLSDLREELERQLQHLHKQAKAAERYTELKQQERLLKAQLQALQWQEMDENARFFQEKIRDYELEVEAKVTQQVELETAAENNYVQSQQSRDAFESVQAAYYSIAADIARCEQALSYQQEQKRKLEQELSKTQQHYQQAQQLVQGDKEKQQQWLLNLDELEPELELLLEQEEDSLTALSELEEQSQRLQQQWEELTQQSALADQQAQLYRSQIEHAEKAILRLNDRKLRLSQEQENLSSEDLEQEIELLLEQQAEWELEREAQQHQIDGQQHTIEQLRKSHYQLGDQLDEVKTQLQSQQGRLSSLDELQQAALHASSDDVLRWMMRHGLVENTLLAENLPVEEGWETAVEAVLFGQLQAVLVDQLEPYAEGLLSLEGGSVTLLSEQAINYPYQDFAPSLLSKVGQNALAGLLAGIYIAESTAQALSFRLQLAAHESIITKDGVWLGKSWLRALKEEDAQAGMLKRRLQIEKLEQSIEQQKHQRQELEQRYHESTEQLAQAEQQRESQQKAFHQVSQSLNQLNMKLSQHQAKLEQLRQRRADLQTDADDIQQLYVQEQEAIQEARMLLEQAIEAIEERSLERETLLEQREDNRRQLDMARQSARRDKDRAHQLALQAQNLRAQVRAIEETIARSERQQESLSEQILLLERSLAEQQEPDDDTRLELEVLLDKRLALEANLAEARNQVELLESQRRDNERARSQVQQQLDQCRLSLEQARLASQTIVVQRDAIVEQMREANFELDAVLLSLPVNADEKVWQDELQSTTSRIQRLGAINLAAIEEYEAAAQRKTYLDAQNADLEEALETLNAAIRRIDRETRARFKETFEQVNSGLQDLFPKVFGGGRAYLALTGEDLLDTGVAIMAQPPGKRNSTIHLLSGGEKALTAIALVFSIFRLNPAPFCMLDEVDAPLDDANVGRYARMVKEMSEQVQFIYITHNKIAMEMAQQLLGVTMHEPGVSRIVTVDVEEAAELAAS